MCSACDVNDSQDPVEQGICDVQFVSGLYADAGRERECEHNLIVRSRATGPLFAHVNDHRSQAVSIADLSAS